MNIKEMAAIENEVLVLRSIRHEHVVQYLDAFHQGRCCTSSSSTPRAARSTPRSTPPSTRATNHSRRRSSRAGCSSSRESSTIHGLDILHRDLSTKNVLLTAPPSDAAPPCASPTLGSRRRCRRRRGSRRRWWARRTRARPSHRGERYGRPADLWGVGVILFELLTLSTPFTAQNVAALCQQIITAAYDDDALARCPHPDALTHLASRDAAFTPTPPRASPSPSSSTDSATSPTLTVRTGGMTAFHSVVY